MLTLMPLPVMIGNGESTMTPRHSSLPSQLPLPSHLKPMCSRVDPAGTLAGQRMQQSVCYVTAFDESVFDEDPFEVMKNLVVWYTRTLHQLIWKKPFGHWRPGYNAITDLSWLAFSFNLETNEFKAIPCSISALRPWPLTA